MTRSRQTRRSLGAAVLAASLALAGPVSARYMRPDVEKVPVERIVENLTRIVEKDPKNVPALVNLARAHAMAYALKSESLEVWRGKAEQGAWPGYEPRFVPFSDRVQKAADPEQLKAARKHLAEAIERYKQALAREPGNLPARLGHAWLLEQAGQPREATKEYRAILQEAWKKDQDLQALPLGGHTLTAETAGYLIPLLDPNTDKEEIAALKERVGRLERLPRPITPIAVPLRDGLRAADLEDRAARVAFDADGSGLRRTWSWISRDAAWLVYDPRGTGRVDSALQMFGNVSFWMFWADGYQALAALDDDGDGRLAGRELAGLALWHDANSNGVADPGEVKSLAAWSIVALSCRAVRDRSHPGGILAAAEGVTFGDGRTRPTYDLILQAK